MDTSGILGLVGGILAALIGAGAAIYVAGRLPKRQADKGQLLKVLRVRSATEQLAAVAHEDGSQALDTTPGAFFRLSREEATSVAGFRVLGRELKEFETAIRALPYRRREATPGIVPDGFETVSEILVRIERTTRVMAKNHGKVVDKPDYVWGSLPIDELKDRSRSA